ncbi:hypothetical protein [Aliiroseovarius sp. 2305UL8-7]|uniref:hypothetical protein n=1 Tax=Aliiroseovarius conchicola TaxID=3121637 RepID=UPI0035281BFF
MRIWFNVTMNSAAQPPFPPLLKDALSRASKIDFYQDFWGGKAPSEDEICWDWFVDLPFLNKQNLNSFYQQVCRVNDVAQIIHTGGTSGQLGFRAQSNIELEEYHAFFNRVSVLQSKRHSDQSKKPLALVVDGATHASSRNATGKLAINCAGSTWWTAKTIANFLLSQQSINGFSSRVEHLYINAGFLLVLTEYLMSHGYSPRKDTGVNFMVLSGEYVNEHIKYIVEHVWGATYLDRYGLSECLAGATQSSRNNGFVFDPGLHAELVPLENRNSIYQEAVGEMALTELLPVQMLQPLVRYNTGDLFSVISRDAGGLKWRYHGRACDAIKDVTGDYLLFSTDVSDALSGVPELKRLPRKSGGETGVFSDCGKIAGAVRLETGEGQTFVEFSLVPKFSANLFPEAAQTLRKKILRNLFNCSSRLLAANRSGAVKCKIVFIDQESQQNTLAVR